jgi:hypothetical protein
LSRAFKIQKAFFQRIKKQFQVPLLIKRASTATGKGQALLHQIGCSHDDPKLSKVLIF